MADRRIEEQIRDIAEQWLYDGDTDQPLNDGYLALFDIAAEVAALRTENDELRIEVAELTEFGVDLAEYEVVVAQRDEAGEQTERVGVCIDAFARLPRSNWSGRTVADTFRTALTIPKPESKEPE